jgi:hypothetical protein
MLAAAVAGITQVVLLALAALAAGALVEQVAPQLLLELLILAVAVAAVALHLPLPERAELADQALSFCLYSLPITLELIPGRLLSPPAVPIPFLPSRLQGATQHEPFC